MQTLLLSILFVYSCISYLGLELWYNSNNNHSSVCMNESCDCKVRFQNGIGFLSYCLLSNANLNYFICIYISTKAKANTFTMLRYILPFYFISRNSSTSSIHVPTFRNHVMHSVDAFSQ